jgi:hypothetical protein
MAATKSGYDPRNDMFVGSAKTLVEAIEAAYKQARLKYPRRRRNFQIHQIIVSGTNPISEYTVVLQKVGD